MNVDDVVRAKVEDARAKAERERKRRAELAEARCAGPLARHRTKLARLAEAALDNTIPAASSC